MAHGICDRPGGQALTEGFRQHPPAEPVNDGMPIQLPSIRSVAHGLIAGGLAASLIASCGPPPPPIPCDRLALGSFDAAVVVLTDGSSTSFDETLQSMTDDPATAFEIESLGIEALTGVVIVATYDGTGTLETIAKHNLAPAGDDQVRAEGMALRHASCLAEAVTMVPDAVTPEPEETNVPNLLRALDKANAVLDATKAKETALIIHGFSRTDNDGFRPFEDDVSDDSRAGVLALLNQHDLVEPIDRPVVFVDPAEDIASEIAAADVRAFTEMLCAELGSLCSVQTVLS